MRKVCLTGYISEELYANFMDEVGKRKGAGRGRISEALSEALKLWIGGSEEEAKAILQRKTYI